MLENIIASDVSQDFQRVQMKQKAFGIINGSLICKEVLPLGITMIMYSGGLKAIRCLQESLESQAQREHVVINTGKKYCTDIICVTGSPRGPILLGMASKKASLLCRQMMDEGGRGQRNRKRLGHGHITRIETKSPHSKTQCVIQYSTLLLHLCAQLFLKLNYCLKPEPTYLVMTISTTKVLSKEVKCAGIANYKASLGQLSSHIQRAPFHCILTSKQHIKHK